VQESAMAAFKAFIAANEMAIISITAVFVLLCLLKFYWEKVGYFTMRMSPLVPEGVVYATDIQQEMLDIVKERALEEGALNVMPVMGRIDHCGLEPSSVDIVLFVDAYHEFSHPREMMESIVTALKPGGRVYLVEYRLEDPSVLIKERHKMSEKQARLEMEAVGLAFVLNIGVLPQQHILVFRRD